MPDHIHFLLIANYDRDRAIAPLFIAHRLADAIEMAQEGAEWTGASAPEPPPCASGAPGPLADAIEMAQEGAERTGASAPEPPPCASAAHEPLADAIAQEGAEWTGASAPEPPACASAAPGPLADAMAQEEAEWTGACAPEPPPCASAAPEPLASASAAIEPLADAIEMAQEEAERTGASAPEPLASASGALKPLADAMAQEGAEWTGARAPEPLASASAAPGPLADMMARRISLAVEATVGKPLQTESKLRFGERKGGESGGAGAVRSVVFARDCYIELSFDSRQLKAIRHYIKLNPARALWKSSHPDRFICHRAIKSRRLARFAPRLFDGIGALPLLGSPFLFHVRLTLKKSVAEHEEAIAGIVEKARRGMIPVSGFISPGEVEALRRLKAEPRARFIKLLPCELPPRYDPSAEDSREIAAGRLLILSCFRGTPAITSLDMKRNPAAAHAFRRNCLAMNDLAAQLCDNAAL